MRVREKLFRGVIYGLAGWCTEVAWTGAKAGIRGDRNLEGHTYLWMFPIYGLAAPLFEPVHDRIRHLPLPLRGVVYATGFMGVEFLTGWLLDRAIGVCPWDYSDRARWHIRGYVRLDYAPAWAVAGLALEPLHDALVEIVPVAVDAIRIESSR